MLIPKIKLVAKTTDGKFKVYTSNGLYVKVTNQYNNAIKYSFEYDEKSTSETVTYKYENAVVDADTDAANLFTTTNNTLIIRIKLLKVEAVE